jgi:Protein of unknown function (DUF1488)
VRCSVSNEALLTHAKRVRVERTDVGKIFDSHRPIIERVASDAYDAGILDEEGRVPVTWMRSNGQAAAHRRQGPHTKRHATPQGRRRRWHVEQAGTLVASPQEDAGKCVEPRLRAVLTASTRYGFRAR